jgi:hypothetical protein
MTITIETGITIGDGIQIGTLPVVKPGTTRTVTANGNAQVSTSQVKFGTGSYTSNSLSGYLRVTPTTGMAWGTGDFTMEFWYRPVSFTTAATFMGLRPTSNEGPYPTIFINTNSSVGYYASASTRITSATNVITINQWNSIAVVRYSGNTKMYINGTQSGVTFADTINYAAGNCTIGGNDFTPGTFPILGNMDEIRFSNTARYTTNYTPATEAFINDQYTVLLIHCDGTNGSKVFIDSSSTT